MTLKARIIVRTFLVSLVFINGITPSVFTKNSRRIYGWD